jgi:hypothetical protein
MSLRELDNLDPWEWPETAPTLILEALKDRSAPGADRVLAAGLAGDMVILNEGIATALLNVIRSKDESDELRSAAAISLGPGLEEADYADYDDTYDPPAFSESFAKQTQRALHNLYLDPAVSVEVRRHILEASVRNPQDWHTGAIHAAYASKEADWQLTAVFCMGFVKGFDKQILQALKSTDPSIQTHAVAAAGNWELDAAWPFIADLITSPKTEKSLRIAAIWAAASIRPHEPDILEPLVDSYDEDIAEAAMDALSEAGFAEDLDSEDEEDDDYDGDADDDLEDEEENHKK